MSQIYTGIVLYLQTYFMSKHLFGVFRNIRTHLRLFHEHRFLIMTFPQLFRTIYLTSSIN